MKVIGFNGSARKDGNTASLIRWVFNELEKEGIETELYQMGGKKIDGCIACYKCFKNKNKRCSVEKDIANACIEKMLGANAVILGSPVYFASVTPQIKALIDRAGMVSIANKGDVAAQGGRFGGGSPTRRGHPYLRLLESLFPHQPDGRARFKLLEHRFRSAARGGGTGRRSQRDDGNPGPQYGLVAQKDRVISTSRSLCNPCASAQNIPAWIFCKILGLVLFRSVDSNRFNHVGINIFHNPAVAFGCWMDSVSLVELSFSGNSFQEKGD